MVCGRISFFTNGEFSGLKDIYVMTSYYYLAWEGLLGDADIIRTAGLATCPCSRILKVSTFLVDHAATISPLLQAIDWTGSQGRGRGGRS